MSLRLRLAASVAALAVVAACDARRLGEAGDPCLQCHGSDGNPAPPRSVNGSSATTDLPVGAHRAHLAGTTVAAAVACDECHVVPTRTEGHLGGVAATVTFGGPLARALGAAPRWVRDEATCRNVYCHGATLGAGGVDTAPVWTRVDGTQKGCGSCHGDPPPSHAAYGTSCHACHPATVDEGGRIDLAGGQHIDGTLDVTFGGACDGCHGAPPASGAHAAHANPPSVAAVAYGDLAVLADVSPAGGTSYAFGCGHCHPLDAARHMDGSIDVDVAPPAAPVAGDEVKRRNEAGASYDRASGRCSGVYCHSSGQPAPAYAVTPAWTAAPGALGCGGCHGNPPRYASGGAGTETANSHLGFDPFGWETGHFAGLPGPAHPGGSKHGGGSPSFPEPSQAASPITCQACHAETVDPASVAPGGFFWFDTTGDYRMAGGDLSRLGDPVSDTTQCATCHGVTAEARAGRVRPLRHVNGRPDVVFDRRALVPAGYTTGLGALASPGPVRPYYVSGFAQNPASFTPVADAELRAMTDGSDPAYTTSLEHAAWDPATKTCANVGCHVARQDLVDRGLAEPLRWGAPYDAWGGTCSGCHPY